MTGVLAQLISLTAYGNQWLKTGQLPDGFYPGNPAFKHCNTVDFREVDGSNELLIAIDPYFWYRYLQHEGCRTLRLYYHPAQERPPAKEHQLAGMIGGNGIWLIETIFDDHSDFWAAHWQVTRKDDPDNLIWSVTYSRTYLHQPTVNLQLNLAVAAAGLLGALGAILQFTLQKHLDTWADFFQKAMPLLGSDTPEAGYYYEALVPREGYSLEARRILYTAGSAWAFGGMGSWNDQYFEDPEENKRYDEVSARLYDAINSAIVAAVNSSP
jgi:hypothetical protein